MDGVKISKTYPHRVCFNCVKMTSLENFDIESWFRAKYVKTKNGKVRGYDISYEDMLQMFIADKKNMIATECGTGLWSPAMECVIGWKEVDYYQKGRNMLADLERLQMQLMKLEREREEEQRKDYERRNSVEYNLDILKVQLPENDILSQEDKEIEHSFAVSESKEPVWDGITLEAIYNLLQNIDRRLIRLENSASFHP